jgi:hypothetical protein
MMEIEKAKENECQMERKVKFDLALHYLIEQRKQVGSDIKDHKNLVKDIDRLMAIIEKESQQ